MSVTDREATDETSPCNGAVHDRNEVSKFRIEGAVEIRGTADGDQAVGVRELGEDADLGRVFELTTDSHGEVTFGGMSPRCCRRLGLDEKVLFREQRVKTEEGGDGLEEELRRRGKRKVIMY